VVNVQGTPSFVHNLTFNLKKIVRGWGQWFAAKTECEYEEFICLAASRSWSANSDAVSEQSAAAAISEAADTRNIVSKQH
jgi:hypothetical protein